MKTDINILKTELIKIFEESKDIAIELKDPKAWDSITEVTENVNTITTFFLEVVTTAEKIVKDVNFDLKVLKSEEKRRAVVLALDEMIELPWYAEAFDNILIEMVIDKSVNFLNEKFGKDWDLDEVESYLAKIKGDIQK
jgi:hypothetical protein